MALLTEMLHTGVKKHRSQGGWEMVVHGAVVACQLFGCGQIPAMLSASVSSCIE